ncbi:uncharacterized protein LOC118754876, partial [Rhagoletis pomonella]|uniref:uncharacterized protein LOC118754876 n=1 Tax=Rhagoletis pomonella TaxID=28610 RepID=UPI0017875349
METSMKTPPPLTFDGNTKEKWKKWKQKFDLYMKATELDKKEEDRKVAVFLHVIGDEALEKYNTFGLSEADDKKLNAVIKAFEDFCSPKANETVERHVFFTRAQQSGENFTNYLTDLKTLSATCGFGHLKDSLIKNRVVCGIRDSELRNRLLREENLDLDKCIQICRAVELADMQMKTIGEDSKIHRLKNAVLRELTKKNVQWNWDENANQAFVELKDLLCKAPVLQYYDVQKPVVLSIDASKNGLGAVLLQNSLPVAYASKALTQTEQRYAQIEKEALAIAFGCIKFDQQIYGKDILVETDHKPLEAIFKKCINDCPARLQSIRLRLQRYNITVKYKPGKELFLADALSRAYCIHEKLDLEKEIETQVCLVMESFPISLDKKDQFVKETESDGEMQMLMENIRLGWPTNKRQVHSIVKPYYNYSNELSIIDGIIFKVDYFSKYVEVAKLRDMSSSSVLAVLKSQFARHGIPYIVYSDPGTQLNSVEILKFAKDWNFTWKTSSAKYSQSNGMVERHIGTIKRMFNKLDDDPGKDPNLAMLEYRNTPIGEGLKSPNEIMF